MTMNYEDRYNEALKIARDNYNAADSANINVNSFKNTLTSIFSELKESEDERVRELCEVLVRTCFMNELCTKEDKDECMAWIEKQESVGEIVERCKDSWYNEGKIQGKIEGLSDDEKYQQGWHDALEKQGEQKPVEWSEEDERMLKTIIINIENLQFSEEMQEKYYHMPSANKDYYQIRIDWLKSLKDRFNI